MMHHSSTTARLLFIALLLASALCAPAPIAALELSMSESGRLLEGVHDDGRTWSTRTRRLPTGDTEGSEEASPPHYVQHDGAIYFCADGYAMMLSPDHGDILWHAALRGTCEGFTTREGGSLTITTKLDPDNMGPLPDITREVGPGGVDTPPGEIFSSSYALGTIQHMKLAKDIIKEFRESGAITEETESAILDGVTIELTGSQRQEIARIAEALERAHDKEPNNLGYPIYIALVHHALGDDINRERALERLFQVDERTQTELMLVMILLPPIPEADDLNALTFDAALERALAQGYNPWENLSLVSVALSLQRPGLLVGEGMWQELLMTKDARYTALVGAHLGRLWRFSPQAEMARPAYLEFAHHLAQTGDMEGAATWRARAQQVPDAYILNMPSSVLSEAGHGAIILWGIVAAFWLLVALAVLRGALMWPTEETSRDVKFNLLTRLSRAEIVGLLLLPLLSYAAYVVSARAVWLMGESAQAPVMWDAGCYGCEEVEAMLVERPATNDVLFARAYGRHRRGDLDGARELYAQINQGSDQLTHNLGVLCAQRSDEVCARERLGALTDHPLFGDTARYNLGESGAFTSTHIDEAAQAGAPRAILLPPTSSQRRDILLAGSPWLVLELRLATRHMPMNMDLPLSSLFSYGHRGLVVLVMLLLLHALLRRPGFIETQEYRVKASWLLRALQALLPGGAPLWGAFNGLICAVWCAALSATYTLYVLTGGASTNPLAAIGAPSYAKLYGVDVTELYLASTTWDWAVHLVWALMVLNVALALFERRGRARA